MRKSDQPVLKAEDWFCGLTMLVALALYVLGVTVTRDQDIAATLVDNGGFLALAALLVWIIAKIVRVTLL